MRRGGLTTMLVALVVVGSVVPAVAQVEEPAAVVVANQIPNVLSMSATGCNFSPGSPVQITFSGGGGDSREFTESAGDDTCFNWSPSRLNPCRLGASDLPGTQFRVQVEVGETFGIYEDITLEPDTAPPRFHDPTFASSPEPGDQVKAGDEISFEVTAVEKNPPMVWQTGVHTLEVTGPRGIVGEPQQAGANAKACEAKSKSLTVQGSYRVRRSDPAVIELCAVATDYVPNENKKCAKWYTGEVWEGTFTGNEAGGTCLSQVQGSFTLVVSKDGSVSGQGERTDITSGSCTGTVTGPIEIGGTKTRGAFQLFGVHSSNDPIPISESGTRARGVGLQSDEVPPDVYNVELRCVSC